VKYFFDSSGIVKRYIPETGTVWVKSIIRKTLRTDLYVSQITGAEVIAAFAKRLRVGDITLFQLFLLIKFFFLKEKFGYNKAVRAFERHFRLKYTRLDVTPAVIRRAMDLAKVHPLRGYDAVQLASALNLKDVLQKLGNSLIFVSADEALCDAARAESLSVDNPNDY